MPGDPLDLPRKLADPLVAANGQVAVNPSWASKYTPVLPEPSVAAEVAESTTCPLSPSENTSPAGKDAVREDAEARTT